MQDDARDQAATIKRLGDVEAAEGKYLLANIEYNEALRLYDQARDVRGAAVTLEAIALVSLQAKEVEQARLALEQAHDSYLLVGDTLSAGRVAKMFVDSAPPPPLSSPEA